MEAVPTFMRDDAGDSDHQGCSCSSLVYCIGAYTLGHVVQYLPSITKLHVFAYGTYAARPHEEDWNETVPLTFNDAINKHRCRPLKTIHLVIPP